MQGDGDYSVHKIKFKNPASLQIIRKISVCLDVSLNSNFYYRWLFNINVGLGPHSKPVLFLSINLYIFSSCNTRYFISVSVSSTRETKCPQPHVISLINPKPKPE